MVAVVVGKYYSFHHFGRDAVGFERLKHEVAVHTGINEYTSVVVAQIGTVAAAAATETHKAQTHFGLGLRCGHRLGFGLLLGRQNHLYVGHRVGIER